MIIKSDKKNMAIVVMLFCIVIALFVVFWFVFKDILFSTIICIILFCFIFRYWIATGRTIIMNSEGCTITFLFYRKQYSWSELALKQYVDYSESIGYKASCYGGAEFFHKKNRRLKRLMPVEYSAFFHPLSFFFVLFYPQNMTWSEKQFPAVYSVDEKTFRKRLHEWGVKLNANVTNNDHCSS